MIRSARKIALLASVYLATATDFALAQTQATANNPVLAANASSLPGNTNANTSSTPPGSPQSQLTPAQFQQQLKAEMAQTAKDMIASFDQNGDKALNEVELQEALVALSNWMHNNNNRHASGAKGQATAGASGTSSGTGQSFSRAGAKSTGATATGNAGTNNDSAGDGNLNGNNGNNRRIRRR